MRVINDEALAPALSRRERELGVALASSVSITFPPIP
jgi:hypothetical protein